MRIERAQPWLGTRVAIAVDGDDAAVAQSAITAAFARIGELHRRLSFHAYDSELSRLNRCAAQRPLAVHADTLAVLRCSLEFAAASAGVFDPSVGGMQVAAGQLPRPRDAPAADAQASWRDIHIDTDGTVHFARPLWLDFGGIAKGYCVDAAVAVLRAAGLRSGRVDAGGDLRVFGARSETIVLRDFNRRDGRQAVVALREGALAASSTPATDGTSGAHMDTRRRREIREYRAVCVSASDCVVADALTKIVLADPVRARPLLRRYGAQAYRSPVPVVGGL